MAPGPPPIVAVFRSAQGQLHHGWCGRALEYLGRRERLELDFYCAHCFEHVTVPECTLTRIPIGGPAGITGRLAPLPAPSDRRRVDSVIDHFGGRRAAA